MLHCPTAAAACFIRLPAQNDLETVFIEQDRFLAVLPENHYLAAEEKISLSSLCSEPFLLLKKGNNTEVSDIFKRSGLNPQIHFTTWDDYAIMAMVETGLGVSILPELILKRIPYKIAVKELSIPAYRNIALALRSKKPLLPP